MTLSEIADKVLFLDVETTSGYPTLAQSPEECQRAWRAKSKAYLRDESLDPGLDESYETYYGKKAALFAEFGRIVCVSVGKIIVDEDGAPKMRIASYAGQDELTLLKATARHLQKHLCGDGPVPLRGHYLCGHNILNFDLPYICRRALILGVTVPPALMDLATKKPWDIHYVLDTLVLWRFGAFNYNASLDMLAYAMGVPSPKTYMSGEDVSATYWGAPADEGPTPIERIADYCETDVLTTARVLLRQHQIGVELVKYIAPAEG